MWIYIYRESTESNVYSLTERQNCRDISVPNSVRQHKINTGFLLVSTSIYNVMGKLRLRGNIQTVNLFNLPAELHKVILILSKK